MTKVEEPILIWNEEKQALCIAVEYEFLVYSHKDKNQHGGAKW